MHRRDFADTDLNLVLRRLKSPRQPRRHVRIKSDSEGPPEHAIRSFFRNLGSAAETGRLAEPVVKRNGCISSANHAYDQRAAASSHEQIAAQRSEERRVGTERSSG